MQNPDKEIEELAAKQAQLLLLTVRLEYQLRKVLPAILEAIECTQQPDSATINPPAK